MTEAGAVDFIAAPVMSLLLYPPTDAEFPTQAQEMPTEFRSHLFDDAGWSMNLDKGVVVEAKAHGLVSVKA